jgi:predicted nucleic acid-binding protein
MKVIVDTNIIFSVLLNTNGAIGDLVFNSHLVFQFYSCKHMQFEIDHHWTKLQRLSKLTQTQLELARSNVFDRIVFINEELIPSSTWLAAEKLVRDIDLDDVDFIALTRHLKGFLWTGDKALYTGLKRKHFLRVMNTRELIDYREKR